MMATEEPSAIPRTAEGTVPLTRTTSARVALPKRRASVTIHRRVSWSEEDAARAGLGLQRRDSLEETKNFVSQTPL